MHFAIFAYIIAIIVVASYMCIHAVNYVAKGAYSYMYL